MAFKLAEAYVEFTQKGVAAVKGGVDGIRNSLKNAVGGVNALNVAFGALAGGVAVRTAAGWVEAFAEAEKQTAKLEAVVASTGGAAGRTVQQLENQASALQAVTAFEDDVVKGGQAILLTFKNVKGEVFDKATEAALDLATVLDTDLKSSAMMLGKALEDPVRGITALRRAGVSFTQDQQDMIKSLVETNKLAEAQALILEELNTQVGGAARKVGETAFGQIEQFKNAIGDVAEELGREIVPALREWAKVLKDMRVEGFGIAGPAEDKLKGLESAEERYGVAARAMENARTRPEMEAALAQLNEVLAERRAAAEAAKADTETWTAAALAWPGARKAQRDQIDKETANREALAAKLMESAMERIETLPDKIVDTSIPKPSENIFNKWEALREAGREMKIEQDPYTRAGAEVLEDIRELNQQMVDALKAPSTARFSE